MSGEEEEMFTRTCVEMLAHLGKGGQGLHITNLPAYEHVPENNGSQLPDLDGPNPTQLAAPISFGEHCTLGHIDMSWGNAPHYLM